ncbi:ATP-dependent helicase [Paenibacillus sp. GCM10027627]|uniref:ATP-dependent helicase n=1 Tax=unclassified Paenibacillus TaxID=185978 RepID=UPI0036373EF3
MKSISVKFNPQQQAAINHHEGACATIAAAGSGKSTVLVNRIDKLISHHGVPEEEILAISFTNNASEELKNKLKALGHTNVNTGTFHNICGKLLAKEGIYFAHDKLIQDWQIEKALSAVYSADIDVGDIKGFIAYQKCYLKSYNDEFAEKESNYSESELRLFYKTYEDYKKRNELHDFDDYLHKALNMLKANPKKYTYDYILVDEHQDSDKVNNLLIRELTRSGNVFVVFDYRQAIYEWKGSNPEYCMNFYKDWDDATVINLDLNYRSCRNIVQKANRFIERYYGNYAHYSEAIPFRQEDGKINILTYLDRETEAKKIVDDIAGLLDAKEKPNEICVLYRLNEQSTHIEHELMKRDIDYDIVSDGSFFKRKEIAGILGYLKLIINPHDDGAFLDVFKMRNYPLAFFSGKLLEDIKRYAGVRNLSYYEALSDYNYQADWQRKNAILFADYITKLRLQKDKGLSAGELISNIIKAFEIHKYIEDKYKNPDEKKERLDSLNTLMSFVRSENPESFLKYVSNTRKKSKGKSVVKLMSVHASKGLEFKYVFLVGIQDSKFPHERSTLLSEARLFYVAVTRSKDNLTISQIGTGNVFVEQYR